MKIKAYVICFKENIERRKLLVKRFKGIGLDPVFIDAVRGSTLSDEEKSPFLNSGRQYFASHILQDNARGCALSHFKAWEAIIGSDDPFALVFEDDAEPVADNIKPCLKALAEMADRLDVVSLANRRRNLKRVQVKDLCDGAGLYVLRHNDFGAESYFITREAAQKLLAHPRRFACEVDFLIHHWWYHDCQILHLLPSLFAEDGRTSTIGYSDVPKWENDRFWHIIIRRINRLLNSLRKRLRFHFYVSGIQRRLRNG